jgi:mono/diheme cytochrome c family protein
MVYAALAVAASLLLAAGARAQGGSTIWDGVYSEEQAARGRDVYASKCVTCHGSSLEGGDVAPALAGDQFNSTWSGLPLSDLFERIRATMPADAPGTLNRQQVADVLAHLLKSGKFPAGMSPLAPDAAMLMRIRFEGLRPQK